MAMTPSVVMATTIAMMLLFSSAVAMPMLSSGAPFEGRKLLFAAKGFPLRGYNGAPGFSTKVPLKGYNGAPGSSTKAPLRGYTGAPGSSTKAPLKGYNGAPGSNTAAPLRGFKAPTPPDTLKKPLP